MTVRSRSTTSPTVAELWQDVLQRTFARVAHSLKGALNGVSVNLEVVRSRAERPDVPISSISPFATAASSQLDDVIAISEAMLALTRAPREPFDVGLAVRHMVTLLGASARSEGRRIEAGAGLAAVGRTSADGHAARLTIAATLLGAMDASAAVRGDAAGGDSPAIRVGSGDHMPIVVPQDVADIAAAAGIRVMEETASVVLEFPR